MNISSSLQNYNDHNKRFNWRLLNHDGIPFEATSVFDDNAANRNINTNIVKDSKVREKGKIITFKEGNKNDNRTVNIKRNETAPVSR